jgi:hypothetical protein
MVYLKLRARIGFSLFDFHCCISSEAGSHLSTCCTLCRCPWYTLRPLSAPKSFKEPIPTSCLQLKRFTTNGNKNYMSKINDYIPTPLTMNCFCTECLQVTNFCDFPFRLKC